MSELVLLVFQTEFESMRKKLGITLVTLDLACKRYTQVKRV